ncbi:sugar transferase [Limimaricola sp. G21655-S1]|uniref:sugar transferase n=1 Tax=Limimaricola sp. G21655-S1 TaxID=3014768 RepID=UPI0022B004EA|nr:sugar transferase [Limimaricola sp. G21655-S1]MCZ4260840.1 sugar transferase [Limimaricola sp. G21655-S1]
MFNFEASRVLKSPLARGDIIAPEPQATGDFTRGRDNTEPAQAEPFGPALRRWKRRLFRVTIGFQPRSRAIYRVYNSAIALALILLVLPLCLMIMGLLYATQGRPIFYRGPRIGEDGHTFNIIKFRTLDGAKAAALTANRVLPSGSGIETPLGLFLRETRLDELPQLFNVLRGDMNMCGPRPVRPEIATLNIAEIPGYETRFCVKPGMIGPAQAYMSHGTSKAIRSRLNNKMCRAPVSYRGEAYLICIVAACVLMRTVSRMLKQIGSILRPASSAREAKADRGLRFIADDGTESRVAWIDETALALEGGKALPSPATGRLFLSLPNGQSRCVCIDLDQGLDGTAVSDCGFFRYRPRSEFGEHILSRYFFQKVVVPHRSEFLAARIGRAMSRRAPVSP